MERYRFVVCCVLVLTIYELGGATGSVMYTLNPLTESKKDEKTELSIKLTLIPQNGFQEDHIDFTFTAKPLNKALVFASSEIKISVNKAVLTDTTTGEISIQYISHEKLEVSVGGGTDEVLTGDLSALLSCNHPILCTDKDNIEVVIVKETKTLNVTATAVCDVPQDNPTGSVTITLSKDLAISKDITISVSLHDPQGKLDNSRDDGVLSPEAESSSDVMFTNIQWGEYQLIVDCGDDSVCLTLKHLIHFPEPVSVAVHPSFSELSVIIVDLKAQLAKYSTTDTAKPPIKDPGNAKPPIKDPGNAKPPSTTHYMELAVGLIAALVCGLLGYLIYHYRTAVKEWICSKKVVMSNLPKKLHRNAGSKYTKLPKTVQEALHQD